MKKHICFIFGTDVKDGPYYMQIIRRPLSGRSLGHVTYFKNFDRQGTSVFDSRHISER